MTLLPGNAMSTPPPDGSGTAICHCLIPYDRDRDRTCARCRASMLPDGSGVVPRVRRVVYRGGEREADLLAARDEVEQIRSELASLRHRLKDLSRIEARLPMDSLALEVAGSLTLAIMALHTLEVGERSFARRAERSVELWADVDAHPENYVVKEGSSR